MRELIPFGRDVPCPACGIALEIRRVCTEPHPDLDADAAGPGGRLEHLHVECPGCGWSGYMSTAREHRTRSTHGDPEQEDRERSSGT
jgi:hypothetical protein